MKPLLTLPVHAPRRARLGRIHLVKDRRVWTCHDLARARLWDRARCCLACHSDQPTDCGGVRRVDVNSTIGLVLCSNAYNYFCGTDTLAMPALR